MRIMTKWFLISVIGIGWFACTEKEKTDLTINNIIPKPVSVVASGSVYELTEKTKIYFDESDSDLAKSAIYLQNKMTHATGFKLEVESVRKKPSKGIYLSTSGDAQLGEEGHEIEISEKLVSINAYAAAGVFRGIQTLRQLFPNEIDAGTKQEVSWTIGTGTIKDYPRFEMRSSMLDVSRHFFSVDDVKRYIDLIAGLKMNYMHLHLTDDQGWRIEIKSWPNLTIHGGTTEVGGGAGGFYTQEEYKEIVDYASDRFITVIPEIDVPSHTFAALASYAELNCGNKYPEKIESTGEKLGPHPYTGVEVGFCSLCTDKEMVYQFLDEVVEELAAMTPGPYIHLGGDESLVTPLDDYIKFFERAQKIVAKHGKTMIGWEEISHVELDESAVIQYWDTRVETINEGAKQGNQIIVSPAAKTYIDMKYDSASRIGNQWAGLIEVDAGYDWDPEQVNPVITKNNILGIESPLWTEYVENMDDIEYLMFPRIMGYAEIAWTPQELRNWDEYKVRLGNQASRLKYMHIDYYPSSKVPWAQ